MDEVLGKIRDYADKAHGSQMRRYSPDRYIVHPVRVMESCRQYIDDPAVLAAALLHDVLEDTSVSPEALRDYLYTIVDVTLGDRIAGLVEELTDIYTKKNHPRFNRRKRKMLEADRLSKISPEAQTIKYADIIDNSGDVIVHEPDFAKTYLKECRMLLDVMTYGHEGLRRIALQKVDACLHVLSAKKGVIEGRSL